MTERDTTYDKLMTGTILPFSRKETTPNLSIGEKDKLLLAEGNEEVIYNNLLRAYLGLIIKLAKEEIDSFVFSLDEKICAGMVGLWKVKKRYKKRENPNPDSAVFLSVKSEIKRAVDGGRREIPEEEKRMIALDELLTNRGTKTNRLLLKVEQNLSENEGGAVCNEVSLWHFFKAVDKSYKDYCRECLKNARRRTETLEKELEKSLDGKKRRIADALRSAEGTLTILEDKNTNGDIDRNLAIFFLRVWGYNFREIGEDFGLHKERARQIFNEVKRIALRSPEVLAHLSEITNLPLKEISQKI